MQTEKLFLEKLQLAGLCCHASLACRQSPAIILLKKDGQEREYSWFIYQELALQAMEGLKMRHVKAGETICEI